MHSKPLEFGGFKGAWESTPLQHTAASGLQAINLGGGGNRGGRKSENRGWYRIGH